jgi:hypothetical protein
MYLFPTEPEPNTTTLNVIIYDVCIPIASTKQTINQSTKPSTNNNNKKKNNNKKDNNKKERKQIEREKKV